MEVRFGDKIKILYITARVLTLQKSAIGIMSNVYISKNTFKPSFLQLKNFENI